MERGRVLFLPFSPLCLRWRKQRKRRRERDSHKERKRGVGGRGALFQLCPLYISLMKERVNEKDS